MISQGNVSAPARPKNPRTELITMFVFDIGVPLGLFYGLRLAGVNQWLALLVSGASPLLRIAYRLVTTRRIEGMALLALAIMVCGTAVGLLTGDPRLLLARESYITALLGLGMLATLLGRRPFVLSAMLQLLPEPTARSWRHSWAHDPPFRRVMRLITAAWGGAFLIDALARVVMAYTLPVDIVPVLSIALLLVMLIIVVQWSKAYGRRLQRRAAAQSSATTDVADEVDTATQPREQ